MDKVTVFKVRPGITDADEIIPGREKLRNVNVLVDGKHFGVLYIKKSELKLPAWVRYFDGAADFTGIPLRTSATGAVLITQRACGIFAIVFGYGRYFVSPDAVDGRFGLVVALNAVDPGKLRSLDHKRLESVARHTREQISREGDLKFFGLDVERDLLRAVTGGLADSSLGLRLTGAESLSVLGHLPLRELGEKLDQFDALSRDESYKKNFPWVDNIREIGNPGVLRELENRLINLVKRDEIELWLTPPEILDWSNVAGFRYRETRAGRQFPGIDIGDYYDECGSNLDLSVSRLRAEHVQCISAEEGRPMAKWSIYRCLVAEFQYNGEQYVLSEGKWFQVDKSFLAGVDQAFKQLPRSGRQYPEYRAKNEGNYNRNTAEKSNGDLICLDQDLVHFPPRGKIEVCDLYARHNTFVHVKRCGASSVLSHLFSQATVSAELMLYEPKFRQALHEKLPASHRWGDPQAAIDREQFEICFAIIARKGKPLELPFFSRVNLRNTVKTLNGWGFRVSLAEIKSL